MTNGTFTKVFAKQNIDELIVSFKGETVRIKVCRKNFDKPLSVSVSVFPCKTFALYGI